VNTVSSDVAEPKPATDPVPREFDRLESAVRRLADELAGYRARARIAEARTSELERAMQDLSTGALDPVALRERVRRLEQENQDLRRRMLQAQERVRRLIARLDFLREDV
jgi:predicted RNase H-like nuclease (RuvC/YqgF family)